MGGKCRLSMAWLLAGALGVSALASCSNAEQALQRKQLLAGRERTQARQERLESQRVRSPQGDLLPSETKLAGIVMPRGFTPKFVEKHTWTYDAELPQQKVQEYFERRLTISSVEKRRFGEVAYLGVREKSDPNMQAVVLRVSPAPSRPLWTRIVIEEPSPEPRQVVESDDAMRERLAERRRSAR